MIQQFTLKIPNEIFIDNFSENKTITLEYNGPETLLIEVDGQGTVFKIVDEPRILLEPDQLSYVELNASEHIEAAYYITSANKPFTIEHEDIVNPDGSIYTAISNPRIQDYYSLRYSKGTVDMWELTLITRSMNSTIELKILNEKNNIVAKLKAVELPDDLQTVYDNYITTADQWLADKASICPWKYIEFPAGVTPKVPLSLIRLIKELES
jgi:hypothetical protein